MDQCADASPTHPSYFPSCMASPPSWLALHRPSTNPSSARFHLLARGGGGGDDDAAQQQRQPRRWRRLLDRLVREGKKGVCRRGMRASKPLITFGYDAASYAKNFDDTCRADGSRRFRPEGVVVVVAGRCRAGACY